MAVLMLLKKSKQDSLRNYKLNLFLFMIPVSKRPGFFLFYRKDLMLLAIQFERHSSRLSLQLQP